MRILLISVNKDKLLRPVLPIGLGYISASLIKEGHLVRLIDLCFEDGETSLKNSIKEFQPEIIGISIRNIDNQTFLDPLWNGPFIKKIALIGRSHSTAKIVLGGPGFSLIPEDFIKYCNADFGIVGEGEYSFPELLRCIQNRSDLNNIPGLVYFKDNHFIKNPPRFIENLDSLPFPERAYYDNQYYAYKQSSPLGVLKVTESIQTKRGCKFKCIYCGHPKIEGDTYRLRSPKNVVDEIEYIVTHNNINELEIVDSVFNYPEEYAKDICREIIQRGIKIKYICQINPGFISEELVELLKESGCIKAELGTDGITDPILKVLKKGFTVSQIKKASYLLKKSNIEYTHCVFIGSPTENYELIKEGFEVMEDINPPQVFYNLGFRIMPDTELYRIALEEGNIKPGESILVPRFYISKTILQDRIFTLIEEKLKNHENWYLWWGLQHGIPLKDRINSVNHDYSNMIEKLSRQFLSTK